MVLLVVTGLIGSLHLGFYLKSQGCFAFCACLLFQGTAAICGVPKHKNNFFKNYIFLFFNSN
jgi:hypothetical protein